MQRPNTGDVPGSKRSLNRANHPLEEQNHQAVRTASLRIK